MTTISVTSGLRKYLGTWLEHLTYDEKLDLIVQISESLKSSAPASTRKLSDLYGAWSDEQSAEELIEEIRKARNFNHQREAL